MLWRQKYHHSIQCNNISSFLAIVLVSGNVIAIYDLWKSSELVYDQITQYLYQIININIPFAEHNFGPLRHMLILIFLMN
jgi:hypothetical protein